VARAAQALANGSKFGMHWQVWQRAARFSVLPKTKYGDLQTRTLCQAFVVCHRLMGLRLKIAPGRGEQKATSLASSPTRDML
jgi:hypothetical protein